MGHTLPQGLPLARSSSKVLSFFPKQTLARSHPVVCVGGFSFPGSKSPLDNAHASFLTVDQFIACGNSRDMAHELASQIWIAVLDNLEENEHTFLLLKRLAQEPNVFLPYPYSTSVKAKWRVLEKLFTDFRDCLACTDYNDAMARTKITFQPIPSTWLGH